jgi:short-subunit dehydrogenase
MTQSKPLAKEAAGSRRARPISRPAVLFGPMNQPVSDLRGLRIWLVGASSGIGAELARQALQAGARVALSARRADVLQEVAAAHKNAFIAPLDVLCPMPGATSMPASWKPSAASTCWCSVRPSTARTQLGSQEDEAEHTLRTNLASVYSALGAALPDMLARGSGGIALVASVAGYVGLPGATVYGPGKAALINLAEILYSDLRPKGLNVYLINPGFVKTDLTDKNDFPCRPSRRRSRRPPPSGAGSPKAASRSTSRGASRLAEDPAAAAVPAALHAVPALPAELTMQNLDRLLDWYGALDPGSLERIGEFYSQEALFKDPFNDIKGLRSIRAIFAHMFETTEDPRFVILERMGQGQQAFATWRFEFRLKGRFYTVLGATHFRFDAAGLVTEHRDYWDAAEELWQKLPVIGAPVKWLRGSSGPPLLIRSAINQSHQSVVLVQNACFTAGKASKRSTRASSSSPSTEVAARVASISTSSSVKGRTSSPCVDGGSAPACR